MLNRICRRIVAVVVVSHGVAIDSSQAMTFRKIADQTIEATGQIEPGDAQRLAAQIEALPRDKVGRPRYEVVLNSSGGSLVEGLRLGQLFRQKAVSTLVRRGDSCFSACALAFLGGTQAAEVDTGVGRYLEVGAKLGFHGFSSTTEKVVLVNEAFDSARVLYGVLAAYAAEMQNIDLSLYANLLSVSPSSIRIVTTPRELNGLGIALRGAVPPKPVDWARNACVRHVVKVRPINDWPIDERVPANQPRAAATSNAQLRQMLLQPNPVATDPLAALPADVLVTLAFVWQPVFPVLRVPVTRGRGFYYDFCFAYEDRSQIVTLLQDTTITTRFEDRMRHGPLAAFAEDVPLWRP